MWSERRYNSLWHSRVNASQEILRASRSLNGTLTLSFALLTMWRGPCGDQWRVRMAVSARVHLEGLACS
eukprot:478005-Amphidinium_carterae.1